MNDESNAKGTTEVDGRIEFNRTVSEHDIGRLEENIKTLEEATAGLESSSRTRLYHLMVLEAAEYLPPGRFAHVLRLAKEQLRKK